MPLVSERGRRFQPGSSRALRRCVCVCVPLLSLRAGYTLASRGLNSWEWEGSGKDGEGVPRARRPEAGAAALQAAVGGQEANGGLSGGEEEERGGLLRVGGDEVEALVVSNPLPGPVTSLSGLSSPQRRFISYRTYKVCFSLLILLCFFFSVPLLKTKYLCSFPPLC